VKEYFLALLTNTKIYYFDATANNICFKSPNTTWAKKG